MLYDPKDHYKPEETKEFFEKNQTGFERLLRFKQWKLFKKKENNARAEDTVAKGNGGNGDSKVKSFLFHLFNF
jgi:hypothetical protein